MNTPCDVEVRGLASKPELNGRRGRALELDVTSGRYHVVLNGGGETLALKPDNLRALGDDNRGDAGRQAFAMPAMPNNIAALEPKHVALATGALLVFYFQWSMVNAALACGLGMLVHSAAVRQGGIVPAVYFAADRVADVLSRVVGVRLSPIHAGVFVVTAGCLIWWQLIGFTTSTGWSNERHHGRHDDMRTRYSSRGREYDGGYGSSYTGSGGGMFGFGSGIDMYFMLGAMMLANMVWRLGGGNTANGWSLGHFFHSLRNMDMFQMMMFMNLVQQVLGGGGRRRRGVYF